MNKREQLVGSNQFVIEHFFERGLDQPCVDVRNGNNTIYTQDNVLYSYGPHFPLARWLGRTTMFLCCHDTTSTTNRHRSDLHRVIQQHSSEGRHDVTWWLVDNVLANTPEAHLANLDDFRTRLLRCGGRHLRATKNTTYYERHLSRLLCQRNDYSAWLRKFGVLPRTKQYKEAREPMCKRECYMDVRPVRRSKA